ncbi:MAG: DUF2163 domain-containing protein [Alkalilacustris sp.]
MSLQQHLAGGLTTVARAWAITRRDGIVMGFTDHDRDLSFEGVLFRASGGMTARALQQITGLGVDNSEATGALRHDSLTEADIKAGRYDGAELRIWWVNWADVAQRRLRFRGSLGQITRAGGAFRAELLGLSAPLGRTQGRVYQASCSAIVGDARCGVDLGEPGLSVQSAVLDVVAGDRLLMPALESFAPGWFLKGRLEVLDGPGAGLSGLLKGDRPRSDGREVVLWERLAVLPEPGTTVRLTAGCDKRPETCREKFSNFLNFRGFPHIPGEDWLMAVPREGDLNDGGSLRR